MKRKKFYCHYWNRGFCEKDGLCQFVHENSPYCKYGDECYTVKCGFYHSISPKLVARRKQKHNPSTKDNQQEDSDYASDDNLTENNIGLTKQENVFKNYRQYKNLHQEDGETTTEYQRRREEIGAKLQNDGIDMNDTLLAIDFMDPETISNIFYML